MNSDSVISISRFSGGRLASFRAMSTCMMKSVRSSWAGEALIEIVSPGRSREATLQASRMTQLPMSVISPPASATGMNSLGGI